MKQLKDIVLEKLIFNKHTKSKLLVDIKGETCFTQQEIDEIYDFAQLLKNKPLIITNQYAFSKNNLVIENRVILMYFYNEWKEIPPYIKAGDIRKEKEQIITIRFEKNIKMQHYYYNVLYNTRGWIYASRDPVNSCEEAIECLKNGLKKDEILENKFSQNTILEKLVFNKHTKEKTQSINVDITDDCEISDIDKDKIIKFAESLKVKPNIITNFHLSETNKKIYSKEYIYLYFSDDYKSISPFRYDFPLGDYITNVNNIIILQNNQKNNITYNVQINIKGEISDKWLFDNNNYNLDKCLKELKNKLDNIVFKN